MSIKVSYSQEHLEQSADRNLANGAWRPHRPYWDVRFQTWIRIAITLASCSQYLGLQLRLYSICNYLQTCPVLVSVVCTRRCSLSVSIHWIGNRRIPGQRIWLCLSGCQTPVTEHGMNPLHIGNYAKGWQLTQEEGSLLMGRFNIVAVWNSQFPLLVFRDECPQAHSTAIYIIGIHHPIKVSSDSEDNHVWPVSSTVPTATIRAPVA